MTVTQTAERGTEAGTRLAPVAAFVGVLIVLAAGFVLQLSVGSNMIPPGRVLAGLFGTDEQARQLVIDGRLPRAVLALVIGIALGLAGLLMQSLTRNPLADPGLLGIQAGASAAVVAGIAFLGVRTASGYVWLALLGTAVAAAAVYLLGSGRGGGASPVRLVLAGAAISACLFSFVSGVIVVDAYAFSGFRFWVLGSLTGRDLTAIGSVLWLLIGGVVLAFALAGSLNTVALGSDAATALGARVTRTRVLTIVAVTVLSGVAVAVAGPIGFVGLAVPHVARALVGVDHRWSLPMSALLGAVMLQLSDVAGRLILWPQEVGVGIVTAVVGAPVLIYLVRRERVVRL